MSSVSFRFLSRRRSSVLRKETMLSSEELRERADIVPRFNIPALKISEAAAERLVRGSKLSDLDPTSSYVTSTTWQELAAVATMVPDLKWLGLSGRDEWAADSLHYTRICIEQLFRFSSSRRSSRGLGVMLFRGGSSQHEPESRHCGTYLCIMPTCML